MTHDSLTMPKQNRRYKTRIVIFYSVGIFLFFILSFFVSAIFFKKIHIQNDFFSKRFSRVLIVFAHADDEVTNAGLIKHWAQQGSEIKILTLTDGSANPNSDVSVCQLSEDILQCRKRELTESAHLLGINHVVTPFLPDSQLMESLSSATRSVENEIKTFLPEAILTMEPSGLNGLSDHRAAFLAVAQALQTTRHSTTVFLSALPMPFSWFLHSKIPTKNFPRLQVFGLSSELLGSKIEVALAHKSQAATIRGLSLGLGPQAFFSWIDFETYSVLNTNELLRLNAIVNQPKEPTD